MNPKKPMTASVRIREETYARIAMDGVANNVKSIDVVEAMALLWFELTPTERAIRLGTRPRIESQKVDAGGRVMGAYLASS
jgi:hypothetical protein